MSAVRFTPGVVPHMRKQGGDRIINLSTASAHTPLQMIHDYSSAKSGRLAFSKSAAFELAPGNILVNCVCPAVIRLPLWEETSRLGPPAPLGRTAKRSTRTSPMNSR